MGKHIAKFIGLVFAFTASAKAAEMPAPPPVPASLTAPELTDTQREAVEQAFREIREIEQAKEQAVAAAQSPVPPPPPPVPENLPRPLNFDSETQAKLDASFAPIAMQQLQQLNMSSIPPASYAATLAPASVPQAELPNPSGEALVSSQELLLENVNFLDFWPEDKKRQVMQELYLGLEKDEVPADSLVGRLLKEQRERVIEEGSIFRQVRNAYRAREHLMQPVRLTAGQ